MFNFATTSGVFRPERVLGGLSRSDADSYRTLSCGPDPADPSRVLIRKIIQINETTYGYEETRITKNAEGKPSVHSQVSKLHGWNLHEQVSNQEAIMRAMHRALPNVIGFSLYYRKTTSGINHLSVVENTLWKASQISWGEWWQTLNDRRDLSRYLMRRWEQN